MGVSRGSASRLRAREREVRAFQLRLAGATYQQIADDLGISLGGAHKIIMRVLHRLEVTADETAEAVRRLEVERLDRMLLGLWPQATKGGQGAVDRVLRIMERRARLLGLDRPFRSEVSGPEGGPLEFSHLSEVELDREIEQLLNQLAEHRVREGQTGTEGGEWGGEAN
jgi:DNA-binding CsgD family transcriptional regulator